MGFQIGDWVVHCTHGLGQVLAIEERMNNNKTALYYMIRLNDFTIWVPVDENQNSPPPPSYRRAAERLLDAHSQS